MLRSSGCPKPTCGTQLILPVLRSNAAVARARPLAGVRQRYRYSRPTVNYAVSGWHWLHYSEDGPADEPPSIAVASLTSKTCSPDVLEQ